MLTTKEASLLAALEPRAIEEGIEIVTIEVVGSRKAPTIRVYIDTEALFSHQTLTRKFQENSFKSCHYFWS